MMMGTGWLIWVVVAVVVLRLVSRRRWRRDWLWYDDWLNAGDRDGRLPRRGGHRRGRYGRGGGAYGRERRREALENAADRLEEASERLRWKARRGGPTTDDRRPTLGSSGGAGSRRLAGSGDVPDSRESADTRSRRSTADSSSVRSSRTPARKAATPLEELQRRFAEGHITIEQYERELDKLYGLN